MKYLNFYIQPWNLFTLSLGFAWLMNGVGTAPDWDLGDATLMGLVTYLVMPAFHEQLWEKRNFFLAFVVGNLPVETCYSLYWLWKETPEVMLWENFGASWGLFLSCWLVWCWLPRLSKSVHNPLKSLTNLLKRRV